MSTEPETAAAETTPAPLPDLSGAASPAAEAVGTSARADGDAAPESQPETPPGPAPSGQPAGQEPASGPGGRQGTLTDMAALYERISGKQAPTPALESWAPLWAEFDAAEAANARGLAKDQRRLDADYEAAWHRVFGPPQLAVSEQATA